MTTMTKPVNVTPLLIVGTGVFPHRQVPRPATVDEAVNMMRSGQEVQVPDEAMARSVLDRLGASAERIDTLISQVDLTIAAEPRTGVLAVFSPRSDREELERVATEIREAALGARRRN